MNPEDNPMPLVSECNPVDAVECPCCLTVFRVRTLMTDGNGRLMPGTSMRPSPCSAPCAADGSNSRKERNRIMADPKYMRKIQGMCRCQDCGLMADNADIDVELDCDEIVFEWSDADDSQTCNLPPCYGGHRLQTDMTAYDLLLELGVIDDPYARNKERD